MSQCGWLLALVLLTCVCGTYALYEEQAGLFDWHKAHVGEVKHAFMTKKGLTYIGTGSNVLAALYTRNGQTVWRQVLPEHDTLNFMTKKKQNLVTLSSDCSIVRMWYAVDGSLQWESKSYTAPSAVWYSALNTSQSVFPVSHLSHPLQRQKMDNHFHKPHHCDAVFHKTHNQHQLVVVTPETVSLYQVGSGDLVWNWSHNLGPDVVPLKAYVDGSGEHAGVLYIVAHYANGLHRVKVDLATGEAKSADKLCAVSIASAAVFPVSLHFTPKGRVYKLETDVMRVGIADVFTLASTEATMGSVLEAQYAYQATTMTMKGIEGTEMVVVNMDDSSHIIGTGIVEGKSIPPKLFLTRQYNAQIASCVYNSYAPEDAPRVVIEACLSPTGKLRVNALDVRGGGKVANEVVPNADFCGKCGGLAAVFADPGDGKRAYPNQVLLVGADHTLAVILGTSSSSTDKSLRWQREEGLASAIIAQFVQLPDADFPDTGFPNFFERIPFQIVQAKSLVFSLLRRAGINLADTTAHADDTIERHGSNDPFGLQKLIVSLTAHGTVYGLDSVTGNVVWKTSLLSAIVQHGAASSPMGALPLLRKFDVRNVWVTSDHRVVVLLYSKRFAKRGATTSGLLVELTPTNGHISAFRLFKDQLMAAVLLPVKDTVSHSKILMLVDTSLKVHVHPDTPEAFAQCVAHAAHTFFHVTDVDTGVIKGYSVVENGKQLSALNVWTLAFPADIEKISAVSSAPAGEVVQSAIKVLGGGDSGFLYKYLNPHLMAVATVRAPPAQAAYRTVSSVKSSDPSVTVYLIDTVTGAVLQKLIHRNGAGPVHVAVSENIIVYHYFNGKSQQYEMSVVELYQDRDAVLSPEEAVGGLAFPIKRIQQTYVLNTGIKCLRVTETLRGITSKSFIVGLNSDQVYSISKQLLDPRRPIGEPTAQDREEGLIPYFPGIPIDPKQILSYTKQVRHLRAIETFPVLLESTSLVLSYGLDMFFSRVTPSMTFDMLNEDFNAPFLVATVSGVAVAIVLTYYMAKAKRLNRAWS